MRITATVKAKGGLKNLAYALETAAYTGLVSGGRDMAKVCEATANDMARYPTGELESSIMYEHLGVSDGVVTGQVVARTDHAAPFHFGAEVHFVPLEQADPRMMAGLYENIYPVYKYSSKAENGEKPETNYNAPNNTPNNVKVRSDKDIIGYIASSSPHPFFEEGFTATKDTVVQEIANKIAEITGI